MSKFSLSHLNDGSLGRGLAAIAAQHCTSTAGLLAYIAEFDARKLYLPAAYPSMYLYCVHELHLCEQAALRRIRAARTARRFPAIFAALDEGRLHLSAVLLLAPYLTEETADDLLAAAAHKNRSEIKQLLAQRFPRPDVPTRIQAVPSPPSPVPPTEQLSPATVEALVLESVPGRIEAPPPGCPVTPLAPERYALQVTIGQSTHELLRYAQALLGHSIPSGDVAQVLHRMLALGVGALEKQKFAATRRPRPGQSRSSTDPRHIPAHVKRAVWERDQGQCTFVNQASQRCPARTRLEFDHVEAVARGGEATVEGIRVRCRAHNQYEAERTFGAGFMDEKRAEARARAEARKLAKARAAAAEEDPERSVVPWLMKLGFRAGEARRAAAQCETIPDASLEQRLRFALSHLAPPHRRVEYSPARAT